MSAVELYPDAFVKVSFDDVGSEHQRDPAAEPWHDIGKAISFLVGSWFSCTYRLCRLQGNGDQPVVPTLYSQSFSD